MKIQEFSILILVVILLVSLILNYLLFSHGKTYYQRLNSTRLDPLGSDNFSHGVMPARQSEKIRVIFYGDSRAASWNAPDIEAVEFINRGIGGQTSTQVLQRFDLHLKDLLPNIIVVQVGINDLKTIPLFPEQKDEITQNVKDNIAEIVQKSDEIGAHVILTTIFPTAVVPLMRKPFWSDDIDGAITDVNQFILSLASEKITIFDAYSMLVGSGGKIKPGYSLDLLHLNTAGYNMLNDELTAVMINMEKE